MISEIEATLDSASLVQKGKNYNTHVKYLMERVLELEAYNQTSKDEIKELKELREMRDKIQKIMGPYGPRA